MAQLRLFFLGSPQVWLGEQALTFPTRKALALLVYLATEGGLHSREKLQTLFWPDSNPGRGRGALRTTLAYLRRVLDSLPNPSPGPSRGSYLLIEPDTLGFNFDSPFELDLQRVVEEAVGAADHEPLLQRVVNLYRGDFLEGFSLPDAPAFDEWASLQREHWHRRLNSIFDRLSQHQSARRHFSAGIATATRWIAHDPLNEAAHQRLMQLCFMVGERATALQVYANCQRILETELGVAPSAETKALAEHIRASDLRFTIYDLRLSDTETNRKSKIQNLKSVDLPFVGRSTEHAQLTVAYQAACQDQAQVVVIEGEAGIGKTRLATEFLHWLSLQGADCLQGLAFEAGGRLPYQPIVDTLRNRIEQENAPDDLLSDVWLAELSRLLPELRDRYPDLPPPTGDEHLARTRLLEAVVRLGLALAERRPVVILIDDIQWADTASLDLLHYTSQRWVESHVPILLVLALRIEALLTTPALGDWLSSLERQTPLTRLALGPITAEETVQLVNVLAGDAQRRGNKSSPAPPLRVPRSSASFAQWLFAETTGQPFFIAETLKALIERGLLPIHTDAQGGQAFDFASVDFRGAAVIPAGVRQVILARLKRLSPTALALLTAAAVIGRNCSFEHLCQVAGVAELDGLPALDQLLASRLLLETHDLARPYRFAHDKIRDVVYTEAGDARRRIFHRRAFEGLETLSAPPAELAHHAQATQLTEPAFRYSLAAGDEAMRLFAVREAIAHYEQALTLATGDGRPETGQTTISTQSVQSLISNHHHLYLQLGRAYELTNEWDKARTTYETMLALAQEANVPEAECAALNRLATLAAQIAYDIDQATRFLQRAIQVAESCGDQVALAEAEWNLAQIRVYIWDIEASLAHAQRALALARQLDLPELTGRSLTVLGFAENGAARWEEGESHYEEARQLYAALGNRALEAESLCGMARAKTNLGQPQAAIDLAQAAHALNLESDNTWGQAVSALNLGFVLLEASEWAEALTIAQAGVSIARAVSGFAPLPILNLTVLGNIYRAMLALDAAQAAHREAIAISESRPHQPLLRMTAGELCVDCALVGDWEAAYRYARQSLAADNHSLLHGGLHHWYITEALMRGGEVALARADAQRFGEQFGHSRRYQIPYRRCLAVLDLTSQPSPLEGEGEKGVRSAIAHLKEANTLAEAMSLPGEQWQILAALGELYRASEDEAAARRAFARAAEIVQALAAKIDDDELRRDFLAAEPIRCLLAARDEIA